MSEGNDKCVYVVVRSRGEYSDRVETPIRYCLTEQEAKRAVELAGIEAQRDAHIKPRYPDTEYEYGWKTPDGSWLPDYMELNKLLKVAKRTRKPDADAIKARNEASIAAYYAQCLALGHVDPDGSDAEATYYYARVTLWEPR